MTEYTDGQIEAVFHDIGIEVITDTDTNLLCLCPYHNNTDSPALSIDKRTGAWMCFAPHCDERGNLVKIVMNKLQCNMFVAKRLIANHEGVEKPLSQYLEDIFEKRDDLPTFDINTINRLADNIWGSPGQIYMNGRGFTDKTLAYFNVGYSEVKDMITIPVHDWDGNPVGMVGRSVKGKTFKNTKKLPTRRTLFNAHRAKRYGEKVVITESATDAMYIHQAGFPWVIATNGSIFSDPHVQIINRYWNEVIIMTDFDDPKDHREPLCKKCTNTCMGHNPGRALGEKMIKLMPNKRVTWAAYEYGVVYPHGAKDAGQLTAEEISQCINNRVTSVEYQFWKHEFQLLNLV
jgi:DNA primase